jgi:hypothetical protein
MLRSGDAVSPGLKFRKITRTLAKSWSNNHPAGPPSGNRSLRWDLLETICVSPVVLLAFAAGETQAPERSGGERGGGKIPLLQKPYKTKGESMLKEDPTL